MDLRSLPIDQRRKRIEEELGIDLSRLHIHPDAIGSADERNCEQMFGSVPLPVGYAGPLRVRFSSGEIHDIHLPLATTEGALVASINRGCKALTMAGRVETKSTYHGVSRSLAFKIRNKKQETINKIEESSSEWKAVGEATSSHLKILRYELDESGDYVFLTIYADTDEAMGMNMVTIAGNAIGKWIEENLHLTFVTVAGNVDSDKKPSIRVKARGRGYEVEAWADIPSDVIATILKTTPSALIEAATAKLTHGAKLAGSVSSNLHAANIIAALYLATGQDAAHVVEGSLAETAVSFQPFDGAQDRQSAVSIRVRCPAILVGVRGGGTELPAQHECLSMLLSTARGGQDLSTPNATQKVLTPFHPCKQLAESIGAAVLAGELSLLAALSSHHLASAHAKLGRGALRSL